MSQNSKVKRERYAKKQEEEGKNVVKWIIGGLVVLGLAYMIWTFTQV